MISNPLLTRFDPASQEVHPRLQMAAVLRPRTKEWALPEANVKVEAAEDHMERALPLSILRQLSSDEAVRGQVSALVENAAHSTFVFEGCVPEDARNTDNAWVETRVVHIHVPGTSTLAHDLTLVGGDGTELKWIDVTEGGEEFSRMLPAHRKVVVAALTKKPSVFFAPLASITNDASSLAAVVAHDLDAHINEWNRRVAEETAKIKADRAALEAEREVFRTERERVAKTAQEFAEGTAYLERVLGELLDLRRELHVRLDATPLDLDAEALRAEWRLIEEEKLLLSKSSQALEAALEKLADAQAAMDVTVQSQMAMEAAPSPGTSSPARLV